MKHIIPLTTLTILLSSCTTDITPEHDKPQLEIRVDVSAYDQDINGVSTRASLNSGVITTFAPGDDLGLIVIGRDGTIVADNYRYVVQKTGLAYRTDAAGNVITSAVYYDENYTYIAYAPYSSEYDGLKSVDEITTRYKTLYPRLYSDQSTPELYCAADLLVCREPQHTDHTLRLTFTHAMSQLKIFYNGGASELDVEHPVRLSQMCKADGSETYTYIFIPQDDVELYGTALSKHTAEGDDSEVTGWSYWQTNIDLKENSSLYVSISAQPTESYKTAGVDMGFPSGCIWANHNLGTESATEQTARGGKWYDANGNIRTDLMSSELHACFDRGDYYSWGELVTKYGKPAVLFNSTTGRISATGDTITTSGSTQTVYPLKSGSDKGYYPETYVDRNYSYANIDGNIAGTEYDVVRNKLWKGEWRIPNENEVDELMRNCDITVHDTYYEDNVRYAPWIAETDASGNYVNLHPDNSEHYGTAAVRPYRYLVTIFKFTSKFNGEVLYFPGGTWSDWSIDMLATNSRSYHGVKSTDVYSSDYGGMYYFASSASHDHRDCSSYMELETKKTVDPETGKITKVDPIKKKSTYTDHNGNTVELMGLTQNGHRYTGMLIRPVYGGRNWNTNPDTRATIRINVQQQCRN